MPGRPAAYIIDLEVLHKTGSEEEGDEQYWLTQDHIVKVRRRPHHRIRPLPKLLLELLRGAPD